MKEKEFEQLGKIRSNSFSRTKNGSWFSSVRDMY